MNTGPHWTSIVAYGIGLPLAVVGVMAMPSAPVAGGHVVALGVVLLLGLGNGSDTWLVRLPVAVVFAAVFLAPAFYGITGVLPLALLALGIAIVAMLVLRVFFRTWLGYSLVFLILCVIAVERVVAAGGGFWLSVLALLGVVVAHIVALVFSSVLMGGEPEQAAGADQSRAPAG